LSEEGKYPKLNFAKDGDTINTEPSTITFNAASFKIGSDYLCMDFGELLMNHEKIKTLVFEYNNGKKYTYKKVEEA